MFCGLGEEERTKFRKKKKEKKRKKKEKKRKKKRKKKKYTSSQPNVGWLGWKDILRHITI